MTPSDYMLYHFSDDRTEFLSSHFHNDIELVFPETDGTVLIIDDQPCMLTPGFLYVLNSQVLHYRLNLSPSYVRYNMYFNATALRDFSTKKVNFQERISRSYYVLNVTHCYDELLSLFAKLLEAKNNEQEDDITSTIYFIQLLKIIYDLIGEANNKESPKDGGEQENAQMLSPKIFQIHNIQSYIHANLTEPLTLDSIAENFYISKYYLSHMFKNMTGYSLMEYVRMCRIEKACYLLQKGIPVTTVSESVGLKDVSRFNRVFKHFTGMTPKQYCSQYSSAQYGENLLEQ